jgi:hypothetical protein
MVRHYHSHRRIQGPALRACRLRTSSIELHMFQSRIEARKAVKTQNVSYRLTAVPSTEPARSRFVNSSSRLSPRTP